MCAILTNLINNKWYDTKKVARHKVDVCFAMDILTDTEYQELVTLTNSKYTETADE